MTMPTPVGAAVVGHASLDIEDEKKASVGLKGLDEAPWMPLDALRFLVSGHSSPLRCLLVMYIIEFAGFGMLIPVIPFFAIHELDCGPKDVGILLSAFSLAQFLGASICGRLSDSIGRYPVIVGAYAWCGIGFGATALVSTYWQFLGVRVAQGLTGGTSVLCDAYILDIVPSSQRAAYIGLFGAARSASIIIGPASGGILVMLGFSRRAVFLFAGSFALTGAVIGFLYLEESLGVLKRRPFSCGLKAASHAPVPRLEGARLRGLLCVWTCRFLAAMGQGFMFSSHAFLIRDLYGWSDKHFGVILLIAGCIGATCQFVLFPRVIAKLGPAHTLGSGCMCGAVSYMLFPHPLLPMYGVALVGFILFSVHTESSLPILVGRLAGEQHLGFVNGVAGSARALAIAVAPLMAGPLYERGMKWTYYSGAGVLALAGLAAVASHHVIQGSLPIHDDNHWSPVEKEGSGSEETL